MSEATSLFVSAAQAIINYPSSWAATRKVHTRRELILAAGLIIALLPQAARAQSTPKTSAACNENPIVIDFQQGTLNDYVRAVKAQCPKANIVIDTGLEKLPLPRAPLPAVSLSQALDWVIGTAAARELGVIIQVTKSGRAQTDDAVSLFTTDPRHIIRPQTTTEERQVKSFSLTDHSLAPRTPAQIRQAIEDALLLQNADAKQDFKYNAELGILSVKGTPRELAIVSGVIDTIWQAQRQATATQLRDDVDKLKKEFEEFKRATAKAVK